MATRIYLTGKVAVEDGGVLIPERVFPGRQARLTFAALVWEREGAISSDRLADVVWDGAPPSAWQTALRAVVSKLRTVLGATVTIEHAFGSYQVRLRPDTWIDVEAATAAVHEAETALGEGALARSMGAALVANAIARRPFLTGDATSWAEDRRAYLRSIRIRALEARGRVALAHGDPIGAVRDAEIVVGLEPYRETAHALLMRAHVASGNPAQALDVYGRLRTRLAEELGTQPSSATEAVFLDALSRTAQ